MPKPARYALIWSHEYHYYELHSQGQRLQCFQQRDEQVLHHWLSVCTAFAFIGQKGRLSVMKEARQGGAGYWYAYRTIKRHTHKRYIGRTDQVTFARLEDIAQTLAAASGITPDTRFQDQIVVDQSRHSTYVAEEQDLLLTSKLLLPRLHASLLARPRLLTRLDDGLWGKLTLLSAPAGSGKTTLVSQWITDRCQRIHHIPVAWISLDAGDNDPARFWRYISTACEVFQPDDVQLPPMNRLDSPTFYMVVNQFASFSRRGILVLEDYHVINSPEIHDALSLLLAQLPAQIHMIVLTRHDPPFSLSRLRAHGDLCEVRGEDLRFSEEETTQFLLQALPGMFSLPHIHDLDRRLEGWATGLHLLTLALQRRLSKQEIEDFLVTFSGSEQHIQEFFVTEVLQSQPEPLQHFLLQTSILDRLCVSLADAVVGHDKSAQYLKDVMEANLFIQALDSSCQQWYRYHVLFAEAMQQEAQLRFGERMLQEWCNRASRWYEQQQMFPEAIEMALRAQQHAQAAKLIERSLKPHFAYKGMNEYHTLQRWLRSLPESVLRSYPRLCVRTALLLIFSGQASIRSDSSRLAQIDRLLLQAEESWQVDNNQHGLGEILIVRALLRWEQGKLPQASDLAREALSLLPVNEAQWRASCYRILGEEAMLAGRVREADQIFQEVLTLFQLAGNSYAVRETQFALAEVYRLQGILRQAAELFRAGYAAAGEDFPHRGKALLGLAQISYEWNLLDTATQKAQEALEIGVYLGDEELQVKASLVLANIEQANGQRAVAQQRLSALFAFVSVESGYQSWLQRSLRTEQARFSLAAGELMEVERWLATWGDTQGEDMPYLYQEQELLITSRLLALQGREKGARYQLKHYHAKAHQQGRMHSEVAILIALALISFPLEQNESFSFLNSALTLAQTEGYQRLFLDEGEAMAVLLYAILPMISERRHRLFVQTLLRTLAQPGQRSPLVPDVPDLAILIEPLSPQEKSVLHLLVAGYTNAEIASRLIVSINTVKTQVHSIYRKLNVKNRREARDTVLKHQRNEQEKRSSPFNAPTLS